MSSLSIIEYGLAAIKVEEASAFAAEKITQIISAFFLLAMVILSSALMWSTIIATWYRKAEMVAPARTPLEILQGEMAEMKSLPKILKEDINGLRQEIETLRDGLATSSLQLRDALAEIKELKGLVDALVGHSASRRGAGIPDSDRDNISHLLKNWIKARYGQGTNIDSIYMG